MLWLLSLITQNYVLNCLYFGDVILLRTAIILNLSSKWLSAISFTRNTVNLKININTKQKTQPKPLNKVKRKICISNASLQNATSSKYVPGDKLSLVAPHCCVHNYRSIFNLKMSRFWLCLLRHEKMMKLFKTRLNMTMLYIILSYICHFYKVKTIINARWHLQVTPDSG